MCGCTLILFMLPWSGSAVDPAWTLETNDTPAVRAQTAEYHDRARRTVEEVLAASEFGGTRTKPSLWERLTEWLRELLQGIGHTLDGLPSWLFWVLLFWMVLTLLAILGHLLYVIVGLFGTRGRPTTAEGPGQADGRGGLLGIRDMEAETAHEQALRLLTQGDWAAATRYLYVAAILWMDRHGHIHYHQAKTNHDYIRELGRHPQHQSWFRHLTRLFETAVYGGHPATETSCREMITTIDTLRHDNTVTKS